MCRNKWNLCALFLLSFLQWQASLFCKMYASWYGRLGPTFSGTIVGQIRLVVVFCLASTTTSFTSVMVCLDWLNLAQPRCCSALNLSDIDILWCSSDWCMNYSWQPMSLLVCWLLDQSPHGLAVSSLIHGWWHTLMVKNRPISEISLWWNQS